MRTSIFIVPVVFIWALATAEAFDELTFVGDTTGGPTMDRPVGFSGLSGTVDVPYFVRPFYVDMTGQYVFEVNARGSDGFDHSDVFSLVYENEFDDGDTLTNLIAGDDDYVGSGTVLSSGSGSILGSRIALVEPNNFGGGATGLELEANVQYFAVITGFLPTDA